MESIDKKIKLLDFKLAKNLAWDLFWVYKTTFLWQWMEFLKHQEYVYWDNIKDIDWKASAKTNHIQIKKYEEERNLNVLFLIDCSKSLEFWSNSKTKRETQEEIFYFIGLSAINNNDNVWAVLYDEKIIEFINFKKWFENLFKILESVEKNKNKTYKKDTIQAIKTIEKLKIKNSLIFILTDDENLYDENILRLIWIENEVIFINIFDYIENNLFSENIDFSINSNNNFINIFNLNKNKIEKYKTLRKRKILENKQKLNINHIWYLEIDDKKNSFKELIWYFNNIK